MTTRSPFEHDELMSRISRDLADGYDEELEMEIEDRHPLPGARHRPEPRRRRSTGETISSSCFGCKPSS